MIEIIAPLEIDLVEEKGDGVVTSYENNRSKGERKIADIWNAAGIKFTIEYAFDDLVATSGRPLRFDFAVFDDDGDLWFLIEYQGEQHYRSVSKFNGGKGLNRQKYNDGKKVQYCHEKNIPLIVIPYYDFPFLDYDYIMNKVNFY